jgi:hypothetical protein
LLGLILCDLVELRLGDQVILDEELGDALLGVLRIGIAAIEFLILGLFLRGDRWLW